MKDFERDVMNECYHCLNKQSVPGNAHLRCLKPDVEMTGDPHGIKNGWFFYPLLFDPTWKTKLCDNYETNEQVDAVISQSVSVAGESK